MSDFASGCYFAPSSSRLNSEDIDYLPPKWDLSPQGSVLRTQLGSWLASASGPWSQRAPLALEVWRMPVRRREPPNCVQHFRTK